MDVKQAVQTAKEHVAEIFADESIANIGLEEYVAALASGDEAAINFNHWRDW